MKQTKELPTVRYAVIFFIIALVAGAGMTYGASQDWQPALPAIAQTLFYIFLVIFLITLILGLVRRT